MLSILQAAAPEWKFADSLSVHQAAHLWFGIDPTVSRYDLPPPTYRRVTAMHNALHSAVLRGSIPSNITDFKKSLGSVEGVLIDRDALVEYAKQKGERPAFLFDTLIDTGAEQPALQKAASGIELIKIKRHGNSTFDWNAMIGEMFRVALTPDGFDAYPTIGAMVRHLLEWFTAQEQAPDQRDVEKRVSIIYRHLGRGGENPAG